MMMTPPTTTMIVITRQLQSPVTVGYLTSMKTIQTVKLAMHMTDKQTDRPKPDKDDQFGW